MVNVKDFSAKYREKHEVYHFASHECGIYVPHYDLVTIWHLRDIVAGRRKKIFGKNVKFLSVP